MSEYVTAAEAAEQLGCSETHIRRLIERGDLNGTKKNRRWRILRSDLDMVALDDDDGSADQPTDSHDRLTDRPTDRRQRPTDRPTEPPTAWRDDLLAQVARAEAEKDTIRGEASRREEASKARIIDLERAATVRESRIADLEHTIGARDSRIADLETTHADELAELRGQVAILEAKVREILEKGQDEALQLANRIADLVDRQQAADARIYELQPVAERVPMLEAAVDEKDAALFERERRLSDMRADIEAIASRPVAGPMFRYLTRGKLRR
jgi:excisionase family DNA binding protein